MGLEAKKVEKHGYKYSTKSLVEVILLRSFLSDEMVIQLKDARPVCFITSSEGKSQVEEIKKIYSGLKVLHR